MNHDEPRRDANNEPLCRGYDWTEPTWVPSQLTEPREVGQCSWLESTTEYDDAGDPYEDHISHQMRYVVRPDGAADVFHSIEDPWGSGEYSSSTRTLLQSGDWDVDYFETWPAGFGSRSGVRLLLSTSR